MNFINYAGYAGLAFMACLLVWFIFNPISRDRVLVKINIWYFMLVVAIMVASITTLAWYINEHGLTSSDPEDNPFHVALQYALKMREAKEKVNDHYLSLRSFILIMLFQVVVFEGLVLAAIVGWTGRRSKKVQKGEVRYSTLALKGIIPFKKYAVVIGANEVAPSVIKNLLKAENKKRRSLDYAHEKENDYVILQTSSKVDEVRKTLRSYLTPDECDRVIIYSDLRNSYEGLQDLHLKHASEIYVLGENTTVDGGETFHDTMNMRCVNMIADILGKRKNRKVCKVLFEYQTTFSIFQFSDVPDKVKHAMHFIPFNRYDSWARRVMMDNKAIALVDENNANSHQQINYTPLDGFKGIKPDDTQRVHFIVVGMSKMGVAMGTQALFQAHYPNYVRDNNLKSRITFIDANAEQEMQFFRGRYATLFELARHRYIDAKECKGAPLNSGYKWIDPMLDSKTKWGHLSKDGKNFLDVEIEFVKGELESEGVREYLRQVTADKQSKVTIAICLPLTHQSVAAALYMPLEVYKEVQEIWVYQREASDIITNINPLENQNNDVYEYYKKLKPFGMLYGEYIDSRTYYLKALLVNGIYEINDIDNKMYFTKINLGDKDTYIDLRKSWKNLTVEKTWSNKYFVDTIYQKVRSTNLALSEEAAIIGYNNEKFFTGNWKESLNKALAELSKPIGQDKKEYLAECEQDRKSVV